MPAGTKKLAVLSILMLAFLCYSFFLYTMPAADRRPANKDVDAGKLVWQKYNCNACHQVYGLGGYLGPDLTNVYSKKGEEYILAFLKSGTNAMPVFNLNPEETKALLAFLKDMDISGKADPRTFTINKDGTIEQ